MAEDPDRALKKERSFSDCDSPTRYVPSHRSARPPRLVSRRPPNALLHGRAHAVHLAPRTQGFVMQPMGAVAMRSSAVSTESPVMLFGGKKPAAKKAAKKVALSR